MHQIIDFFQKLLDTGDWPPRWQCGQWSEFHGWLYIVSDIGIWLAYFIIPVIIIWFVQRKPNIPFLPVFWLFGAFIILCGTTHLIDALIFWWPGYRLSALMRFFTAIISFVTVFALIRDIPKLLNLKIEMTKADKKIRQKLAERDQQIANLKKELAQFKSNF